MSENNLVETIKDLRAWADHPSSNGFTPIHPDTLRRLAGILTVLLEAIAPRRDDSRLEWMERIWEARRALGIIHLDSLEAKTILPDNDAARDVLMERQRQLMDEGWSLHHDDEHEDQELAAAAASYAFPVFIKAPSEFSRVVPITWPDRWSWGWWKPRDRRRDLVRAGALILAEIERIDRAAAKKASQT